MEVVQKTFDIGLEVKLIAGRTKINLHHGLVDGAGSPEQSHFAGKLVDLVGGW